MRTVGAVWGVVGSVALLVWAIGRLIPYATEALTSGLLIWQWVITVLWFGFMLITEGYDGFYKRLAPRIITRSREIRRSGDWAAIVFAPLFCFGYFRAPLRRMLVSYVVLALIICAVIVAHQLSQPWRGIVDAGVVGGLAYGIIAIVVTVLDRNPYIVDRSS